MRLITLDAETYWDRATKFSLTNMTATAYVRDRRFQEIGWAARIEPTSKYDAARATLHTEWHDARDWQAMHDWLVRLALEQQGTFTVTHNGAGFDYLILGWHHGVVPWMALDTLQMSRVLYGKAGPGGAGNSLKAMAEAFHIGAKGTEVLDADGKRLEAFSPVELARYGRYCCNDVDLTAQIARRLIPQFTEQELRVMSILTKMSAQARIVVDVPMCQRALELERERKAHLLEDMAGLLGCATQSLKDALMSNPKFAALLTSLGVEPPTKISKTTGKQTFAFAKNDPGMLELADSDDELVADIVRMRVGINTTILETRLEHFIAVGNSGPMPAAMRYGGAHTGRASADGGVHKCQLHNLPSRGKEGKRNALRMSLRAPEGYSLCGADSSQIEVRVLAALAGEDILLDAFERNVDPYLALGPALFGREITKADKYERNVTKAAVLAAGYKQGANGFHAHCLRNEVNISPELALKTITAYRELYAAINGFWGQCKTAIKALAGERRAYAFGTDGCLVAERGQITLPSGRRLEYRDTEGKVNDDTGFRDYTFWEKYKGFRKYIYDGLLTENITQAVAYDVVAWQAMNIEAELGEVPVLFTHDELIYCISDSNADSARGVIERWMTTTPPWLPYVRLACEWGQGPTYADV